MKRFLFILLAACLLLPCAALAADGDLQELGSFSAGLVAIDPDGSKDWDFVLEKKYSGTDEKVLLVANEYISPLMEKYGMEEIDHFTIYDEKLPMCHGALSLQRVCRR